jgi:exodeoxyribonuclease VII small subunit
MNDSLVAAEGSEASFEAVYLQLEQAVSRLEAGGLGLEESIGLYEAGMRLARRCKEMLDAAELRVIELEQELASTATERALDDEEAD